MLFDKPIDAAGLKAGMAHPAAGAYAEFEGWVRNHNEGRAVASLEYEAFSELAAHEGAAILAEVRAQFDLIDARCVHRTGHLQIGELAVWVGVTARHRDAAFRACRAIIDAVKARLPIWKKEHYIGGGAEWVRCDGCAGHGENRAARPPPLPSHADEREFYCRQVALPLVGEAGQKKLTAACVLVVGAGGLGCPVLQYLAAAGVGQITVCDGDTVEASNLHRQVLFDHADIGRNKAEVAAEKLCAQNPFITVMAHPARCDAAQVQAWIAGCDVVLDCTDNFASKFLLHDACYVAKVPLVQASIYQFEGQLQVFRPGSGAGCLRCLWPEAPEDGCVGTCADVGVLGAVPGVLGALQAGETLKLILGLPGVCDHDTLLIDLLALDMRRIARDRNPQCPLCGALPAPMRAAPMPAGPWIVDARKLTPELLSQFRVVDIRGADEREGDPHWVQCLPHVDWTDLDAFTRLDPQGQYLLVCAAGVRSRMVASKLRKAGHANFYSLHQGIDALEPLLGGN